MTRKELSDMLERLDNDPTFRPIVKKDEGRIIYLNFNYFCYLSEGRFCYVYEPGNYEDEDEEEVSFYADSIQELETDLRMIDKLTTFRFEFASKISGILKYALILDHHSGRTFYITLNNHQYRILIRGDEFLLVCLKYVFPLYQEKIVLETKAILERIIQQDKLLSFDLLSEEIIKVFPDHWCMSIINQQTNSIYQQQLADKWFRSN